MILYIIKYLNTKKLSKSKIKKKCNSKKVEGAINYFKFLVRGLDVR